MKAMQLCCVKQHGRSESLCYRPEVAPQIISLEMAKSDVELFAGAIPQLSDLVRVSSWVLNPTNFKSMQALSLTETFVSRRAEVWPVDFRV